MNKINTIFNEYKLPGIGDIQMDFIIINLKLSEFINLLIDIHPEIHSNSKIYINNKTLNSMTIEDLNKLKYKNDEMIDIIAEIGVNISNEKRKNSQLLKYPKLIHNINRLKKQNAKELPYLLDLLHLNGSNKKLLLFMTNGPYSNFINFKNNECLTIRRNLNVDSLLIFKDKNELFKISIMEHWFKKYKQEEQ